MARPQPGSRIPPLNQVDHLSREFERRREFHPEFKTAVIDGTVLPEMTASRQHYRPATRQPQCVAR